MANRRLLRVAGLFREEITDIIRGSVHDPRVTGRDFTIIRVEVSADLAHADVHVSTLLKDPERTALIDGMQHAAGFIRRELMHRVHIKTVPALDFQYDGGLAQSQRIADLLNSLKQENR
jgi:ribosome-binding factor A